MRTRKIQGLLQKENTYNRWSNLPKFEPVGEDSGNFQRKLFIDNPSANCLKFSLKHSTILCTALILFSIMKFALQ